VFAAKNREVWKT